MDERTPEAHRPRLRQAIVLCTVCVTVSALGMFFAHPIGAQFHMSASWVLPAIAVGILTILAIIALVVLPKMASRRA